eukprot:jgi/Pico_ML_1/51458/g2486.t1
MKGVYQPLEVPLHPVGPPFPRNGIFFLRGWQGSSFAVRPVPRAGDVFDAEIEHRQSVIEEGRSDSFAQGHHQDELVSGPSIFLGCSEGDFSVSTRFGTGHDDDGSMHDVSYDPFHFVSIFPRLLHGVRRDRVHLSIELSGHADTDDAGPLDGFDDFPDRFRDMFRFST